MMVIWGFLQHIDKICSSEHTSSICRMTDCSSGGCWSNWEDPPEPDCSHEKCCYVSWVSVM